MVCSTWSVKMTALTRLVNAGSIPRTATDMSYQKLAAHYIGRELRDADEDNLLDEEDMHIFGLSPMSDPLDLVCCNACKKPIKASRYAAHAELCKFLSSTGENNLELDGPAVTRKPLRKEKKKSQIIQTKKATSLRESKKSESAKSGDIASSESLMDESIQMSSFIEAQRNTHLNATHKMNGSTVNPYHVDSLEHGTKRSPKPLKKRTAAESPSNPGAKNLCKATAKVLPYVPAPIATKIYYSQRGNNLRSAISRMFFEEPGKESTNEVPCFNVLQVNVAPEPVASQQRDDKVLHLAQTPDQIISARSNFDMGNSVASLTAAQLPVNNTLEPQYISNSYSFADKPGEPPDSLQQGSGSVPVV